MQNLIKTVDEVLQKHDRAKIDLEDIRQAAVNAALEIIRHAKETDGFLSGETITQIIMEHFDGFTKK